LQDRVTTILKVQNAKDFEGAVKDPAGLPSIESFSFTEEQRAAVFDALQSFIGEYDLSNTDSAVRWYYGQAYSEGLLQAVKLIGKDKPVLDIIHNIQVYDDLCNDGFALVKNNATRAIEDRILPEMQAQMLAGTNPTHVASRLEKLFGDQNSDWQRLARSEMTMAAERAKRDEWKEWGVDVSNPIIPVADTHPRCRCTNTVTEIRGKWVMKFTPAPDACALCRSLAD
jgi:hypothetical protein